MQGGGFYIKQIDLQVCIAALYRNDGVHLTFLGNCILLNQWAWHWTISIKAIWHAFSKLVESNVNVVSDC